MFNLGKMISRKKKEVHIKIDDEGVATVNPENLMEKLLDKDKEICNHIWDVYKSHWLDNEYISKAVFICRRCRKSKFT